MRTSNSSCPASDCSAAYPSQVRVAASELNNAGASGAWINEAYRCGQCQCVYTISGDGTKVVRGYLDNAVLGAGWRQQRP